MANTTTPLHLFENTASQWVDTAAWPPSRSSTYYLGATGTLSAPSSPSSSGAEPSSGPRPPRPTR